MDIKLPLPLSSDADIWLNSLRRSLQIQQPFQHPSAVRILAESQLECLLKDLNDYYGSLGDLDEQIRIQRARNT